VGTAATRWTSNGIVAVLPATASTATTPMAMLSILLSILSWFLEEAKGGENRGCG